MRRDLPSKRCSGLLCHLMGKTLYIHSEYVWNSGQGGSDAYIDPITIYNVEGIIFMSKALK